MASPPPDLLTQQPLFNPASDTDTALSRNDDLNDLLYGDDNSDSLDALDDNATDPDLDDDNLDHGDDLELDLDGFEDEEVEDAEQPTGINLTRLAGFSRPTIGARDWSVEGREAARARELDQASRVPGAAQVESDEEPSDDEEDEEEEEMYELEEDEAEEAALEDEGMNEYLRAADEGNDGPAPPPAPSQRPRFDRLSSASEDAEADADGEDDDEAEIIVVGSSSDESDAETAANSVVGEDEAAVAALAKSEPGVAASDSAQLVEMDIDMVQDEEDEEGEEDEEEEEEYFGQSQGPDDEFADHNETEESEDVSHSARTPFPWARKLIVAL